MSVREFFDDEMRARVASSVAEAENVTAAEIVVSVHVRSGVYREAYWAAGAVAAFVVLLLLLFLPQPFDVRTMPLDVAVAFGIAAFLTSKVPPLERMFALGRSMRERVDEASRAELHLGGTTATRGRTGVLVYVSALEHEVRVVLDEGLAAADKNEALIDARHLLEEAVARLDREAFLRGIVALGKALGPVAPRASDDVDELPNRVRGR